MLHTLACHPRVRSTHTKHVTHSNTSIKPTVLARYLRQPRKHVTHATHDARIAHHSSNLCQKFPPLKIVSIFEILTCTLNEK